MKREWLVLYRSKKNVTQLETSKKVGISRSRFSEIESGAYLRVPLAKKIAEFLEFDWREFYE